MASSGKQLPECKYGSLCYRMSADHRTEYRHPENLSKTRTNPTEEHLPDTGPKDGHKLEGELGFHALKRPEKEEINEFGREDTTPKDALPIIATNTEKPNAGVLLLLLVGVPGSGKSTFCSKLMSNAAQPWTRICQDIIAKGKRGTKIQCLKHAQNSLSQNHSVVIDRCNMDRVQRLEFLQLAARFRVEAHGVVLDLPASLCIKRASKRIGHEGGVKAENAGPIISSFARTRQLPRLFEGFTRITFCKTDIDVEKVLDEYRELLPLNHLEPGVFGAVPNKKNNAPQSVLEKGIIQPRGGDKIDGKDEQVEKVGQGLQQAQIVGREKTEQMQEASSSSARNEGSNARDLASSVCEEDRGSSTLAFPSISTSDFHFDHEKASIVLVEAVTKFLSTADLKMRLLLVDLTNSHMMSLVHRKAREKGLDSNRFLTFVGDITKLRSSNGPACNVIANAANWRLKAGGGGVNAAIHSAAGPDLERATKEVTQTLTPGTSVLVKLPESSPLYRHEGVTHVIHVLGPNMNPQRPNFLSGDYSEGCRILQSAYDSLFQNFSSIVRSTHVTEAVSKVEASFPVGGSSKEETIGVTESVHQNPPRNAFTVLMQASKRNRELKDANPQRDKVRVTEEVVARAGNGTDDTRNPSKLDFTQSCGPEKACLQNEPHSNSAGISTGGFPTAVAGKEECDTKRQEELTGAKGNLQNGTNNEKKWESWALALYKIAMHPEQRTDVVLQITDEALVLHDTYPKAKKHLLVLARRPGLDGLGNVQKEDLPLLRHMHSLGEEWAASFLKEDPSLSFRLGYHMVPSMRQLHLHVISQDFDSASLKNKKHWNSFTTPFFRDSQDVLDQLEGHGQVQLCAEGGAEALLGLELRCHRCRSAHPNLPRLKQHISTCQHPFAYSSFLITKESLAI